MSLQFPQYPRFFTARVTPWLGLMALVALNVWARFFLPWPFLPLRLSVLRTPFTSSPHLEYAVSLWQAGLLSPATRELLLTHELGNFSAKASVGTEVLGAATSALDLLAQWETEPQRLAARYEYWQSVVREKPDYVDGYTMAAALAYQLGKPAEAITLLTQVLLRDPTNETALALLGALRGAENSKAQGLTVRGILR